VRIRIRKHYVNHKYSYVKFLRFRGCLFINNAFFVCLFMLKYHLPYKYQQIWQGLSQTFFILVVLFILGFLD